MKKYCLTLAFLVTLLACSSSTRTAPWILGSIQYDASFENSPITIYFDGNKIKASLNRHKSRVDFEIPRSRSNRVYYLLVTEKVIPVAKYTSDGTMIENTIDYLKVPVKGSYKFYRLELNTEEIKSVRGKTTTATYWQVTEMMLPENGQIPAKTVIILHLPELIKSFETGGSYLSWPSLNMNIPDKRFSDCQERLITISFATADLNTIHPSINTIIRIPDSKEPFFDPRKILIAYGS